MIRLLKISGHSLEPELTAGDFVVILTAFRRISKGDYVALKRSGYPDMIKEVTKVNKQGYFVEGSHSCSVDSRTFGYVTGQEIFGRVILKIRSKRARA